MRMATPSCHEHRYIGVPLGPIGSERRKAPPPGLQPKGRWPSSCLFGPSNCRCDHLEHGLLVDILDLSSWYRDPLQASIGLGKRMPGASPRPERTATPDDRCRDRATGRPTNKPAPPGENNTLTRASNRQAAEPQVRLHEATRRPTSDSAEDDEDQGPDVPGPAGSAGPNLATWGRPTGARTSTSPDAPVDA